MRVRLRAGAGSLLADLAIAVIAGLGARGYEVAVEGLAEHLRGA